MSLYKTKMQKIFGLLLLGFVSTLLFPLFPLSKVNAASNTVVISEVQTGGCTAYSPTNPGDCVTEDTNMEFVEFFNLSQVEVEITNWKVQYVSASGGTTTTLVTLNGTILANSTLLLSRQNYFTEQSSIFFSSSLAKSGGHIKVVDSTDATIDLAGWGTAANPETTATASIPPGSSAKRYMDCETNLPVDTDNNSADFEPSNSPSPGTLDGTLTDTCQSEPPAEEPPPEDDGIGGGAGAGNSCEGVIISELLPNPAGSDTGSEFIELYNPTGSAIPLEGCQLSTSANSKLFTFGQTELNSGQYTAFYNGTTGLTLENSAGGTVFLVDTDGTEINQADYPADLEDGVAWALVGVGWAATYEPTPSAANSLLADKPCPAGEIRNTDTNRCASVFSEAAGLAACKPGQERNPETKRCRNIASLSAVLKACEPGQARNPATNRCRKVSSSSLTPCKPGQERNPQTNRCRKVSGSSGDKVANVKDVLSATSADKGSWALAGVTMAGALGYGAWEWRNELGRRLLWLKNKLPF